MTGNASNDAQLTGSIIDHQRNYPLLIKRIQALFIDGVFLFAIMIAVMVLSEG